MFGVLFFFQFTQPPLLFEAAVALGIGWGLGLLRFVCLEEEIIIDGGTLGALTPLACLSKDAWSGGGGITAYLPTYAT